MPSPLAATVRTTGGSHPAEGADGRTGGRADAAKGEGTDELLAALDRHHDWLAGSGSLEERRRRRMLERTREVVDRAARRWMWSETQAEQVISERLDQVVDGTLSPYDVAGEVLEGLKQGARL
ncbi:MAG TPA: hypothetical protein VHG35_07610 [Gemmatimonadales bacterium]|nr:hypothetical protein [Gemmatimonadales bacterium]